MPSRGYSIVALDQPKWMVNVGGVLRAAGNYDAAAVVMGGERCRVKQPGDTMNTSRHKPVLQVDDVFDALPYDCTPVAIDLIDGAESLVTFKHPERAFYIFGGEDRTLSKELVDKCEHVVYVPTNRCMNLAATVNVVLYDRMAKAMMRKSNEV